MAERHILVTGGSGYLGSALVRRLSMRGHQIRVLETHAFGNPNEGLRNVECVTGDVIDYGAVLAATEGITHVIHLAGIVTDELVDMNTQLAFRVNVTGTENIARAAQVQDVQRMIYVSSSSVYGRAAEVEGDVTEDVTPRPKTSYAEQKLAGEMMARHRFFGELAIVRPATMCGPAPRMRLDTVVNVFSKQAWFDRRITVHGGDQYRSNVHVEDAVDVFELLLEASNVNGNVYNIACSNMPVYEIAREAKAVLADSFGRSAIIETVPVRDSRSYRLTARALRDQFAWQPKRSIRQAILDNLDWFRAGNISDPESSLYYNTRRMAETVGAAKT